MKKTYRIETPPQKALSWSKYKSRIEKEWKLLLASSHKESDFQAFLEKHPCYLPWKTTFHGEGHHGIFPHAVVSQPRLTGLAGKIPDFLWISRDSESVYAVLIEIESPRKKWFTSSGKPSANLTQAINQIHEWKQWFDEPSNRQKFILEYSIPSTYTRNLTFQPRYILIYGRRRELENSEHNLKRVHLKKHDEDFLSYDTLFPDEELKDYITAKIDGKGYRAISIPPTIELGPESSSDFALIRGKEDALVRCKGFNRARKQFLAKRWHYWDEWAKSGERGVQFLGDEE
jgi:antiviral defense system Shedu protein SduA